MLNKIKISNFLNTEYRQYSMYTISSRGIPNINDGLTPSQRLVVLNAPKQFQKTLSLVGDVIKTGNYHHGNCLKYDTKINLADDTTITIGEWCDKSKDEIKMVKCVDENNNSTISIGHSPRIGQVTNIMYQIELANGEIIECTANHPFKLKNGEWKNAEFLDENDELFINLETHIGIKKITKIKLNEAINFYDITVEKHHNFSIGDSNIIVHNSSLENVITRLCKSFQCSEPILLGDGFFGTPTNHNCAPARYTSCKLNPKINKYLDEFKHLNAPDATGLIRNLTTKFPIGLLQISLGIAVGFATKILPRNPIEIEKFLSNKKADLRPYFKDWQGNVSQIENNHHAWLFSGKCEVKEKSIIFTSIPPFMQYAMFLKKIASILQSLNIADNVEIINRCTNEIDFEIKFKNIKGDDFQSYISSLITANQMVFTENIVLIDNDNVIEYETIEDYLTQFKIKNILIDYDNLKYEQNKLTNENILDQYIIEFLIFMLGKKRTQMEIDEFYSNYDKKIAMLFDGVKLKNLNQEYINKLKEIVNGKNIRLKEIETQINEFKLPENFTFQSTRKNDFDLIDLQGIDEFIIEEELFEEKEAGEENE